MSDALLRVIQIDGKWWIHQKGWENQGPFDTEDLAYSWADKNIDDQVFGDPNSLAPELRKRKVS